MKSQLGTHISKDRPESVDNIDSLDTKPIFIVLFVPSIAKLALAGPKRMASDTRP
jgi:hypothetical protein